ncbi:MAG: preprotein translocase subunit SecE [Oscillospiraceae bacterium]|jgi:preprotein translocase subunit SecE|nr:preprotein translocase subunit SecE [Oscillospiraceae bacterium]
MAVEGNNSGGEKKKELATVLKVKEFFREFKRVVWPTPRETFKNTGITLAMIFVVGIFVFLVDLGLIHALSAVMNVSR